MERHPGRRLKPYEHVHHLNGVRGDNRIENLELWKAAHPHGVRLADAISDAVRLLRDNGYRVENTK